LRTDVRSRLIASGRSPRTLARHPGFSGLFRIVVGTSRRSPIICGTRICADGDLQRGSVPGFRGRVLLRRALRRRHRHVGRDGAQSRERASASHRPPRGGWTRSRTDAWPALRRAASTRLHSVCVSPRLSLPSLEHAHRARVSCGDARALLKGPRYRGSFGAIRLRARSTWADAAGVRPRRRCSHSFHLAMPFVLRRPRRRQSRAR
jgi:hypothetical protein